MRGVTSAAAVAALVAVAAAAGAPDEAAARCKTRACKIRVTDRQCSQHNPRACVMHVIHRKRLTGWRRAWMLRIPWCESRWNPSAISPAGHVGLFQFARSTWATTPYRRRWIFSARWQAFAAAWMLAQGRAGEWACR